MAMLYPYLELAASFFILLFAYHLGTRHYGNKTARFFVRFAMVAFLAAIFSYSLRIAFTLELARHINRISATLVALSFALFAHFALIFTKKDNEKNRWELPLLYFPVLVLGVLFICTDLMYQRYEIYSYGIASIPSPWYLLFLAQNIIYAGWGIILFSSYAFTAQQKVEREQSLLIAVGSLVPVLVGITTDELLPLFTQLRLFPPTIVLDFAFLAFFVYWAMRKYSLFAISPALASQTIIETMPDSLIVTDLEGRIMFVNEEAHKYFHDPKDEIYGRPFASLFEKKEQYDKLLDDVLNRELEVERFEATLCDPAGECLPSLINANALRYELGDLNGIVFIIRDSRG